MTSSSLSTLPSRLLRRLSTRAEAREESRFHSRLGFDPDAPELLLSPHWDDAVLDCWSLLTDAERDLTVVNVFAGMPQEGTLTRWDAVTGARDSALRAQERMAEDAEALSLADRPPVNLPLLDAEYREPAPPYGLDDLDRALAEVASTASHVHVPAGIGANADHLLVRRYGRLLLRAGIPVTVYAELPYCVLHGWPHWVDGRDTEPTRNVDAFWLSFLVSVPEMPPLHSATVEWLDEDVAAAKLDAMRRYRTQLPSLSLGGRGLLEDPEIHGYEVRWRLGVDSS
jgi:LmbE family N-acetylglucosaminyl deacetylase